VMRAGSILQTGAPTAVYARPTSLFVAGFLGSPQANFLEGDAHLESGRLSLAMEECRVDLAGYALSGPVPAQGQPLTLAIRPENIRIAAAGPHEGRVTVVEPMGNHQVLWIEWHGRLISCLAHDTGAVRADQPVRFDFDVAHASLFDAGSERRI